LKLTDVAKLVHPDQPQPEPLGIATDGRTLIIGTAVGTEWLWNSPEP
jgi:hypothetical protein